RGARGRHLDAKHEVSNVDLVAFADDRRLGDLPPVDVRSVRALQVGDDDASVAEKQPRMALGDIALRQHEVVALHAAHVDFMLVECLATLGSPLLANDDRKHARMKMAPKERSPAVSPTREYTLSRAGCQPRTRAALPLLSEWSEPEVNRARACTLASFE